MDTKIELAQVVERYRTDGYDVKPLTNGSGLPPFATGFHLDLLASKGGIQVLVQVKQGQQDLQDDPNTAEMARVINAQPGWRFDLVSLGNETGGPLRADEEPSLEALSRMLDHVE